jgi:RES domain-containing protein
VETELIRCWRITQTKYSSKIDAFSGNGAAENAGRWNKPSVPIVYACCSIALCVLETLVHTRSQKALNERFVIFEIQIPGSLATVAKVPASVRHKSETREIGDQWFKKGTHVALEVPSIIAGEPNYLLNPKHPDFSRIKIADAQIFRSDSRLFGR